MLEKFSVTTVHRDLAVRVQYQGELVGITSQRGLLWVLVA